MSAVEVDRERKQGGKCDMRGAMRMERVCDILVLFMSLRDSAAWCVLFVFLGICVAVAVEVIVFFVYPKFFAVIFHVAETTVKPIIFSQRPVDQVSFHLRFLHKICSLKMPRASSHAAQVGAEMLCQMGS